MSARGFAQLGTLVYGVTLAAALLSVLLRSPHPVTPELEPSADCTAGDLAHFCRGARAQVSSYGVFENQHPIFAIDGRRSRDPQQRWCSGRRDEAPWLEIRFPEPVEFSQVRLSFSGQGGPPELSARTYHVACRADAELRAELMVDDSDESNPTHPLPCAGVNRLRVDFALQPGTTRDHACLYEIEALP
jgi:hypothetical protein